MESSQLLTVLTLDRACSNRRPLVLTRRYLEVSAVLEGQPTLGQPILPAQRRARRPLVPTILGESLYCKITQKSIVLERLPCSYQLNIIYSKCIVLIVPFAREGKCPKPQTQTKNKT